jgi:hypothetical protein
MAKKRPKPPKWTRSSQRAYQKAVADAGEQVARRRGDPKATERQTRERAFAEIDLRAAAMPTPAQTKDVKFIKRGIHRT